MSISCPRRASETKRDMRDCLYKTDDERYHPIANGHEFAFSQRVIYIATKRKVIMQYCISIVRNLRIVMPNLRLFKHYDSGLDLAKLSLYDFVLIRLLSAIILRDT